MRDMVCRSGAKGRNTFRGLLTAVALLSVACTEPRTQSNDSLASSTIETELAEDMTEWYDTEPTVELLGTPLWEFASVSEMLATSSLAIKGAVVDVRQGNTYAGSYIARLAHIEVREVIKGDETGVDLGSTIDVESGGFDLDADAAFMADGDPWLRVGDVGYFFLRADENANTGYVLVSPDGQLVTTTAADGELRVVRPRETEEATEIGKLLESATPEELAVVVQDAKLLVDKGSVAPLPDPRLEPAGLRALLAEPAVLGVAKIGNNEWVFSGAPSELGYCYELVPSKPSGLVPDCFLLETFSPLTAPGTYLRRDVEAGSSSVSVIAVLSGRSVASSDTAVTLLATVDAHELKLDIYIAAGTIRDFEVQ